MVLSLTLPASFYHRQNEPVNTWVNGNNLSATNVPNRSIRPGRFCQLGNHRARPWDARSRWRGNGGVRPAWTGAGAALPSPNARPSSVRREASARHPRFAGTSHLGAPSRSPPSAASSPRRGTGLSDVSRLSSPRWSPDMALVGGFGMAQND